LPLSGVERFPPGVEGGRRTFAPVTQVAGWRADGARGCFLVQEADPSFEAFAPGPELGQE
jgi:hypothetical protein